MVLPSSTGLVSCPTEQLSERVGKNEGVRTLATLQDSKKQKTSLDAVRLQGQWTTPIATASRSEFDPSPLNLFRVRRF
jgi:hypothetical protein